MFKVFSLILLIFIFSPSASADAEEKNPVTLEDYKLLISTYDSCTASPYSKRYHCDCAAVLTMEAVQSEREKLKDAGYGNDYISNRLYVDMDALQSKSYRSCINKENVAVDSYGQCLELALKTRDDYREFCGCYAMRYSDTVNQEGLNYFEDPASTMARAMISCDRSPY